MGSEPGVRRPVLVVQADSFNRSSISTVLCLPFTTNLKLADAPGNVYLEDITESGVVSQFENSQGLPRTMTAPYQ